MGLSTSHIGAANGDSRCNTGSKLDGLEVGDLVGAPCRSCVSGARIDLGAAASRRRAVRAATHDCRDRHGQGRVAAPPATFDLTIIWVAMLIHVALAIVYGLILALIIHRLSMGMSIDAGAVFGLGLYTINFHGFTSAFPWFSMTRGGLSIVVHLVFGVVAALAYKRLQRPRTVPIGA